MSNKYTVLSDNLDGRTQGDEITEKQLGIANIDALIEGGHIKVINLKKEK
jgi:hypothetical protein|tara:strand:- start:397 stop:546 length:150 start_codon:yes stop_codon:yes gene_type:complete